MPTVIFADREDEANPQNGCAFSDPDEVLKLLDSLAKVRLPFFCRLESDTGSTLLVGVGTRGCVQHSSADEEPPYYMASEARGNGNDEDEYLDFLIAGTASQVPLRFCLEWQRVKPIVRYFVETGGRLSTVSWEEI